MRHKTPAPYLILLLLISTSAMGSRGDREFLVDGVILDDQYRRLTNVTLVVSHKASGVGWGVTTDDQGRFDLGMMKPGEYEFQGTSSEGHILVSQSYVIGEHVVKRTDGASGEHLVIVVGTGIRSLEEPRSTPKQPRRPGVLPPWTRSFRALFGGRALNDFWSPNDDQAVGAVDFGFRRWNWPVQIAFGIHYSEDESRDPKECFIFPFCDDVGSLRSRTRLWELNLGVARAFRPEKLLQPSAGAGIAIVNVDTKVRDFGSDDDRSEGGFVRGGLAWALPDRGKSAHGTLGFEAKWLFGTDIEIFGMATDVDYIQLAAVLGVTW